MTLDAVTVDLKYSFGPGLVSVALSRVKCPSQLRVLHFSRFRCPRPQADTLEYINSPSQDISNNLNCCRHKQAHATDGNNNGDDHNPGDDNDDDNNANNNEDDEYTHTDDSDEYYESDDDMDTDNNSSMNDGTSTDEDQDDEMSLWPCPQGLAKDILTILEEKIKDAKATVFDESLKYLSGNPKMDIFCQLVWDKLAKIMLQATQNLSSVSTQSLTSFQQDALKFWLGEFCTHTGKLFEVDVLSREQRVLAADTFRHIKAAIVITSNAHMASKDQINEQIPDITAAGESRIRYLAGRSLFKTQRSLKKKAQASTRRGESCRPIMDQLDLLNNLRITEAEAVETTSQLPTLDYIQRRQRPGASLTHIRDQSHMFFVALEQKRRTLTTMDNVARHKGNILENCKEVCLEDNELKNIFKSMSSNSTEATRNEVYKSLVVSYLRPPQNDFRKSLATKLGKKRQLKHRVNILLEGDNKKSSNDDSNAKCGACNGCDKATPASVCWFWCEADDCQQWYHSGCVGLIKEQDIEEAKELDPWYCPSCIEKVHNIVFFF